jgi:hypothetical protein
VSYEGDQKSKVSAVPISRLDEFKQETRPNWLVWSDGKSFPPVNGISAIMTEMCRHMVGNKVVTQTTCPW